MTKPLRRCLSASLILFQATDLDAGNNGLIRYSLAAIGQNTAYTDPFEIDPSDAELRTIREFFRTPNYRTQYSFRAIATDQAVPNTLRESTSTLVYVSL